MTLRLGTHYLHFDLYKTHFLFRWVEVFKQPRDGWHSTARYATIIKFS